MGGMDSHPQQLSKLMIRNRTNTIFEVVGPFHLLKYEKLYFKNPRDILQIINRFYSFKEKQVFKDLEKLKMIPMIFKQNVPAEMNIFLMMILSEAHHRVKETFKECPIDKSKPKHKECFDDFLNSATAFDSDPEMVKKIGKGALSAATSLFYNSNQQQNNDKVFVSAKMIKHLALIVSATYFDSFRELEAGTLNGDLDRDGLQILRGYFEMFYTKRDQNLIRHHRNIYFILAETYKLGARSWTDGKDEIKNKTFQIFLKNLKSQLPKNDKSEDFDRFFASVGFL